MTHDRGSETSGKQFAGLHEDFLEFDQEFIA
ncbi:hypothetical protein BCF58_0962 [Chryseobacterium defluvii]|uniref:Uncharacterized protein n=1 Tax=Chryseobacterium defluvii TaxID=160396 RepID=A0A495SN49_9FLAO|nr:hypothetical protein BCF58_0962 [Chryseobacterium defluvii]